MAEKITVNTRVKDAILAVQEGRVHPYLDLDGVRYLFDFSLYSQGTIRWSEYDIAYKMPISEVSYSYPYAMHNIMREVIAGPSSRNYPGPLVHTEWPNFPVPLENGRVIP
jgi:hypothetical protein